MLNPKMYVAVVNWLDKFFSELKAILTFCLIFLLRKLLENTYI